MRDTEYIYRNRSLCDSDDSSATINQFPATNLYYLSTVLSIMQWKDHDRWATKLGIPKEISREVNTIIDAVEQGENIPDEYEQHLGRCAKKAGKDSGETGSAQQMLSELM